VQEKREDVANARLHLVAAPVTPTNQGGRRRKSEQTIPDQKLVVINQAHWQKNNLLGLRGVTIHLENRKRKTVKHHSVESGERREKAPAVILLLVLTVQVAIVLAAHPTQRKKSESDTSGNIGKRRKVRIENPLERNRSTRLVWVTPVLYQLQTHLQVPSFLLPCQAHLQCKQ
jgi:hypothetical protein